MLMVAAFATSSDFFWTQSNKMFIFIVLRLLTAIKIFRRAYKRRNKLFSLSGKRKKKNYILTIIIIKVISYHIVIIINNKIVFKNILKLRTFIYSFLLWFKICFDCDIWCGDGSLILLENRVLRSKIKCCKIIKFQKFVVYQFVFYSNINDKMNENAHIIYDVYIFYIFHIQKK